MLYPALFPEDMRPLARDFYARFYHVTPSEPDIERVLAGRD
jgi:iron complex transport system substrate-binding protein